MIGYLCGKVLIKELPFVHVVCGDVGYEIALTERLFQRTRVSQSIELFIHTYVREDEFSLYGFETLEEKKLFRRLISISGVGPKLALAIQSRFGVQELIQCVKQRDIAQLKSIHGVGAKKAEKLLVELKSALKLDDGDAWPTEAVFIQENGPGVESDLAAALAQLGYRTQEYVPMIHQLRKAHGEAFTTASLPKLLQEALKGLSRWSVRSTESDGRSS